MSESTFLDYHSKVLNLKNDLSTEAENVLINEFPECIEDLDNLLKDERLSLSNLKDIKVDTGIPVPFSVQNGNCTPNKRKRTNSDLDNSGFQVETIKGGTKVLVLPSGSVPINHHIKELIEVLKPKISRLINHVTLLRMWIVFLTPKIEDGNNFGVSIQETILEEIKTVEQEAVTYFEHSSRYYLSRAKLVARIAKYPIIDDFRQSLKELDEKQILELRLVVTEMKNQYATIYDLIFKNYEKIKKPKTNNATTMF